MKLFKRGKVRNIYEVGDKLLIIATDRISAFDCVLPSLIPGKGKILTALSEFWFNYTKDIIENHLISTDYQVIKQEFKNSRIQEFPDCRRASKEGACMLVVKTKPVPIECVVRGYLAGSGWKEYQDKGSICGIELKKGLLQSAELPEPIFTPSTKAEKGHDMNISFETAEKIVGKEPACFIRDKSLEIYKKASGYAEKRGFIIADTKFEFGYSAKGGSASGGKDNKIILIDELFTPDSSRFWLKDEYEPGRAQKSFDKQFVRDYLNSLSWDKKPPAPSLPEEIIEKTKERYLTAYRRLIK